MKLGFFSLKFIIPSEFRTGLGIFTSLSSPDQVEQVNYSVVIPQHQCVFQQYIKIYIYKFTIEYYKILCNYDSHFSFICRCFSNELHKTP